MSGFSDFTFLWPHLLWVLLALPILIYVFFAGEQRRQFLLNQLIAIRLQPRLAGTASKAKRVLSFCLTLAGLTLAVLALAGPRWGSRFEERIERGRDLILAIDTSRSMLAQDLKPNRLARAKLAAQDLLNSLEGDRVGLIAFAGSAFLQAPLTADYSAIRDALNELDTEIIPRGGTNLSAAVEAAADAFGKGEGDQRALIIFTDGEDLEEESAVAALARAGRCRIFTVGLGSPEGALLPIPKKGGGTEFVKDDAGQYVTSRLDEKTLREVAEAGGGFYVHLESGPAEMQKIVREGLSKMKDRQSESRFEKQPIERYQWPLAASVLCFLAALLLGERRRLPRPIAAALAGLCLACSPASAQAGIFDKIGGAPDPSQPPPATPAPSTPAPAPLDPIRAAVPEAAFNQGCEAFKSGDFAAAAQSFSRALGNGSPTLQAKAAYNLANTLARRGAKLEKKEDKIQEWKNAIQHYDRTLTVEPNNENAKFNRDLVQKAIAALEKKEEQQDKKDEQKKDEEKKDEEKKDQEKQEQQQQQDKEKQGDKKEDEQKKSSENKEGEQQDKPDPSKEGDQKAEQPDPSKEGKEGAPKTDPDSKEKAGKPDPNGKEKGQPGQPDPNAKPPEQKKLPEPGKPEDKKTGEVKTANGEPADKPQDPAAAEAAEEAAAAAAGRMTKKEAKQVLESIREGRVRLLDPREARQPPPTQNFKDW